MKKTGTMTVKQLRNALAKMPATANVLVQPGAGHIDPGGYWAFQVRGVQVEKHLRRKTGKDVPVAVLKARLAGEET